MYKESDEIERLESKEWAKKDYKTKRSLQLLSRFMQELLLI